MHGVDILPFDKLLQKVWDRPAGTTLLGIGPMSPLIVEASLLLAKEKSFPVMFITSRNQVDCDQFGGGYVAKWDQRRFADAIAQIARKIDFKGVYYLCRDHGGPWQRDEEYREAISEQLAMERAKESYLADLKAGFDLLHIDPTKDPHRKHLDFDTVISRTVELIEFVEKAKSDLGIDRRIGYEVGTEETKGGYIEVDVFREFLKQLLGRLNEKGLPKPDFIVGQTGTLVKMGTNVGRVDIGLAGNLTAVAREFSLGFKEHNADYLSDEQLSLHPRVGITAANVAPEYGHLETKAYLEEYQRERESAAEPSNFSRELTEAVLESGRWKKWLTADERHFTAEDLGRNDEKLGQIVEACGHYVFDGPAVSRAIDKMFKNLSRVGDTGARRRVFQSVKDGIDRYVINFGLPGLLG